MNNAKPFKFAVRQNTRSIVPLVLNQAATERIDYSDFDRNGHLMGIAQRRTRAIMLEMMSLTIEEMLQLAYVQGMADGAFATVPRGTSKQGVKK
jgi:hypothetical protein